MLAPYYDSPLEAGTDEAGRGCLAGPVTAAAVILPEDFRHPLLDDSKKLSERSREILAPIIREVAIAHAVVHISPEIIDQTNILKASIAAMHKALERLTTVPATIAVDGNRFTPFKDIPYHCLIKGDGRFLNIAAASVLAKTERDAYMANLHQEYPEYQWDQNKGYPTAAHRRALAKYGATPYHRKSFRLLPDQLKFEF